MARFDVRRLGRALVVDCQADIFETLTTRFVIPLVPVAEQPALAPRLNPVFRIGAKQFALATQLATAVHRSDLGAVVASLDERGHEIIAAIDMLVTGV